ncbi:hypothetical protein BLNAU_20072 [Blattamonas nauphoetae]|uniref:Uncharacterized protein n=1 Tax=Blattamonas nauphoetae TaxID=2049346 RepID=A0ABQ9X3V3_9EUKA|nr:hypothetical protein BLNAU_20072 [Blattamonas nauphoetae]
MSLLPKWILFTSRSNPSCSQPTSHESAQAHATARDLRFTSLHLTLPFIPPTNTITHRRPALHQAGLVTSIDHPHFTMRTSLGLLWSSSLLSRIAHILLRDSEWNHPSTR